VARHSTARGNNKNREESVNTPVALPLWLFLLIMAFAAWALAERVLVPGVRWLLRRRINRVIDEVNTRLNISIRPFQLTKRQVLIDRLVYDPKVIEAMQAYAQEQQMPRAVAQAEVLKYAKEIVPAFNAYIYFRIGYWLAEAFARLLYRVRVGFADNERLAKIDPQATVVFVMNHRSNMDYVLAAFLAAEQTALSYAVGEWARIWPLQQLVRAMGAYFVRRNSRNPLYRRVLERYVNMATWEGVCQAVFPEGSLSRDGNLQKPKLGILDYMLRGFDPVRGRDIVFIGSGIIRTGDSKPIEERLLAIKRALDGVMERYHPSALVVEEIFMAKNPKSTLTLGQARGVALLVAAEAGIPVFEYSSREVKSSVTGAGGAHKSQVAAMVGRLLRLDHEPETEDETDAIAVAFCHAARSCVPGRSSA